MTTHLETDTNTDVDISGFLIVGTYTATGDKNIMSQVLIDGVAGGGETYTFRLLLQVGGAGNAILVDGNVYTTTSTHAGWQFKPTNVRSGDVLSVQVDGAAGDVAVDTIVRWFEIDNNSLIADAVWDELIADHRTAGTYGRRVKLVRPDNLGRRLEEK